VQVDGKFARFGTEAAKSVPSEASKYQEHRMVDEIMIPYNMGRKKALEHEGRFNK
jgi:hypothetical protein